MRVVLDANVYVSALISGRGSPARILAQWKDNRFDVVISPQILDELERVVRYPKIRERYAMSEQEIQGFLRDLRNQAITVVPSESVHVIEADAEDNRYLECAVAGRASVIVSGDRHLLALREYRGIQILFQPRGNSHQKRSHRRMSVHLFQMPPNSLFPLLIVRIKSQEHRINTERESHILHPLVIPERFQKEGSPKNAQARPLHA